MVELGGPESALVPNRYPKGALISPFGCVDQSEEPEVKDPAPGWRNMRAMPEVLNAQARL